MPPRRPGADDRARPACLRVAVLVSGQGSRSARADLELRGRAPLRGTLERFEDEAGLSDLVSRLERSFRGARRQRLEFEPERDDHRSQLRGIVGFRFVPERIELKFKLNQNHPLANRHAVAAALSQQGAGGDAIAALMLGRTPTP